MKYTYTIRNSESGDVTGIYETETPKTLFNALIGINGNRPLYQTFWNGKELKRKIITLHDCKIDERRGILQVDSYTEQMTWMGIPKQYHNIYTVKRVG